MRLSIIVPVYNMAAGDKLKHCMESLLRQTLPAGAYEIIAVDDCSTDDSLALLKAWEREYPDRLTVLSLPVNHHQGGAKNAGLAIAAGDWIGFIDADDWVTPDYYERLLTEAEKTGADMVACDYSLVDHYTFAPGRVVHTHSEAQTGVLDEEKYRLLLLDSGSLVIKIYRRYIVLGEERELNFAALSPTERREQIKEQIARDEGRLTVFPEDTFYEDNAVGKTWMLRAKHFAYIPEPLYFYLQHETSTVHTFRDKHMEDRKTTGRLMLAEAKEKGYYETYKEEIDIAYIILFYVNTLFTAMRAPKGQKGMTHPYRFTKELGEEFFRTLPEYRKNRYYRERVNEEQRNDIDTQQKSQLLFYLKYRLRWWVRDLYNKPNG